MKRIILGMSLLCMSVVLAGCISIPIGDNVLHISTDGIDFEEKEVESAEVENINEEDSQAAMEVEQQESERLTAESTDNELSERESKGKCDDNYEALLDELPQGFAMPECASSAIS